MGEVTAYIGLGSNLGDGRKILRSAWKTLGDAAGVELVALARPYRTAPVGMASEHWFTNSVGCLRTSLAPEELLSLLFRVEADFGRKRDETVPGYHDRSLDLDLLYFGELCLDTPRLVLPHPGITERLFVLVPLAELDPCFVDPQSGASVDELVIQLRKRLQDEGQGQDIVAQEW